MSTMKLRTLSVAMIAAFAPLASHAQATTGPGSVAEPTQQLDTTAQSRSEARVARHIASSFTGLAGSEENALKLVQGLHDGTAVTLTGKGSAGGTTITPPTGKMGWGNVVNSLALAQQSLANAGITKPTAAQLQAALTGGNVKGADGKTVTFKGILTMRAEGKGWGQIAHATGTNLGSARRALEESHREHGDGDDDKPRGKDHERKHQAKGDEDREHHARGDDGKHHALHAPAVPKPLPGKGVVTAGGTSAGAVPKSAAGKSHVHGQGVVTAASTPAATAVSTGTSASASAGVVNAAGGNPNATLASANGNSGGNGHGQAHGKGKGGG